MFAWDGAAALPVFRYAVRDGFLMGQAFASAPANRPGFHVKQRKKARFPISLPSLPLAPSSPPQNPKERGYGETRTHLKLFRVKLVDRWVSGPGSHWQVRLLVVRFMRQDRLWGVEGGSAHRVGREGFG